MSNGFFFFNHQSTLINQMIIMFSFQRINIIGQHFYIPAKFKGDDVAFAKALAKEALVGVTPGSFFGNGGKGYIRMSYASSDEDLHEALKRIGKFVSEH